MTLTGPGRAPEVGADGGEQRLVGQRRRSARMAASSTSSDSAGFGPRRIGVATVAVLSVSALRAA
jgi:hypothetical protein